MDNTVTLGARMSKREAKIIEGVAKAQGLTVSAYLRAAGLSTAVLEGDMAAMKYMGGIFLQDLAKRGQALIDAGQGEGERVRA